MEVFDTMVYSYFFNKTMETAEPIYMLNLFLSDLIHCLPVFPNSYQLAFQVCCSFIYTYL